MTLVSSRPNAHLKMGRTCSYNLGRQAIVKFVPHHKGALPGKGDAGAHTCAIEDNSVCAVQGRMQFNGVSR